MSSDKDNRVDWTAASMPGSDRVVPGLSRKRSPLETHTRNSVMDTLLGENNLSAYDAAGNDPYNTTGRFARR